MKCQQFEQMAGDYFDGSLEPAEAIAVERHAAVCGECSAMFADLRFSLVAIDDAPFVQAPDELVQNILQRTAPEAGSLALAGGGVEPQASWRDFFGTVLQPRFALSMAMAVLSMSMLTWFGQRSYQDWQASGEATPGLVSRFMAGIDNGWAEVRRVAEDVDYQLRLQTELGDLSGGEPAFLPAAPEEEPDSGAEE